MAISNGATPKRRTRGQGEGSIYQRASDGKWVAVVNLGWRDGKRERKYLYGTTRDEVAKKLTKTLSDRDRGLKIKPERQTLTQLLDRWYADVVPNLRPNTALAYRNAIDSHLIPALGTRQLVRLSRQDVLDLLSRERTAGFKPETVNQVLSVLRMALSHAERSDLVPRNVAQLVDRPRIEPFEAAPLTPEEANALLTIVANDRLVALYQLSVRLGLRQGEALGLRWRDIDLETGLLSVRYQLQRVDRAWTLVPPKTKRSRRTVELSPFLAQTLIAHREVQAAEREEAGLAWQREQGWDLVFCTSLGAPIHAQSLGSHLHAALARAGLSPRRWHDLRHTAVTLMLAAGVPERVIMEIMGHSQLDMTRIYGLVLPPLRLNALASVDDLLNRAKPLQPIDRPCSRRPRRNAKPLCRQKSKRGSRKPHRNSMAANHGYTDGSLT